MSKARLIKKAETIIGKISALQVDAPRGGTDLQEAARLIRNFIKRTTDEPLTGE
jgi:hypothetical protein